MFSLLKYLHCYIYAAFWKCTQTVKYRNDFENLIELIIKAQC